MNYVKDEGYYVGCFDENDIANKLVMKAMISRTEENNMVVCSVTINTIVKCCNDLSSDEKLEVFGFGKNNDLVLHIYKDEEYDTSKDKDYSNLVRISTAKDGKWVDDTEDIYVTDGSLHRELERINNYENFSTL